MRTRYLFLLLPILAILIGPGRGQDTLKETGPTSLIIQYRCFPARRRNSSEQFHTDNPGR